VNWRSIGIMIAYAIAIGVGAFIGLMLVNKLTK